MENQQPRPFSWKLAVILIVVCGVPTALVFSLFLTHNPQLHRTVKRNTCIANLTRLDGAVRQWALERQKKTNDLVLPAELLGYLKGSQMPVCPSQGIYRFGRVVDAPTCSVKGHTLGE